MSPLLFTALIGLISFASGQHSDGGLPHANTTQPQCEDVNAEFKVDGSPCPPTCSKEEDLKPCPRNFVQECQCKEGFVRDEQTHRCVRENDCTPRIDCKDDNARFIYHGTACPPTCNKEENNKTCTLNYVQGCQCDEGFVKDEQTSKCVMEKDCTPQINCEGPNEIFNYFGSACPPTCSRKELNLPCPRNFVPSCQCKKGFVRDEQTRQCVRENDCTPIIDCKNGNATFTYYGTACPPTCNKEENNGICTLNYVQGCQCIEGFVKDEQTDECVMEKDCTPKIECSGVNEIFTYRGSACPPTCSGKEKNLPCTKDFVHECQCKKGFVRNELTGQCVLEKDC